MFRVPKKLMKLTVNFGRSFTDDSRRHQEGSAKNPARKIEGRQALFVVNLEPRKMAGEISEGMLFDIGYADGVTPVLSVPERPRFRTARGAGLGPAPIRVRGRFSFHS